MICEWSLAFFVEDADEVVSIFGFTIFVYECAGKAWVNQFFALKILHVLSCFGVNCVANVFLVLARTAIVLSESVASRSFALSGASSADSAGSSALVTGSFHPR